MKVRVSRSPGLMCSQHAVCRQRIDGGALLAVAWGFFERVKHLLGWTTVTGGTRGGAALCKQPLMAKPLSGLCVCSRVCSTSPQLPVLPDQVLANFNATRLLKAFLPFHGRLCLCPFRRRQNLLILHRFSLLQFLSGLFHHQQPPPPAATHTHTNTTTTSCFFPFLSVPRSLSYSSPSLLLPPSRRPPPLSEEIDWVIWLGASSARFLARGKERSGGDMTTCRNNNNIHNIGRVGMDGGMRRRQREREEEWSRRWHIDVFFTLRFKYSRTQTACHNIVSPSLSVSICLSICLSPPPSAPPFAPVSSFNIKQCVECRLQADGR